MTVDKGGIWPEEVTVLSLSLDRTRGSEMFLSQEEVSAIEGSRPREPPPMLSRALLNFLIMAIS